MPALGLSAAWVWGRNSTRGEGKERSLQFALLKQKLSGAAAGSGAGECIGFGGEGEGCILVKSILLWGVCCFWGRSRQRSGCAAHLDTCVLSRRCHVKDKWWSWVIFESRISIRQERNGIWKQPPKHGLSLTLPSCTVAGLLPYTAQH